MQVTGVAGWRKQYRTSVISSVRRDRQASTTIIRGLQLPGSLRRAITRFRSGCIRARCRGRLSRRSEVEIRDLAGLGLAVRDERGNGPRRLLRNARRADRDEDHHPPPGFDDPLLRKPCRTAVGPTRHTNPDEDYSGILAAMTAKGRRPTDALRMLKM